MKSTWAIVLSSAATLFTLTACGGESNDKSNESKTSTDETQALSADAPTYSVAVVPGFEPYTFRGEDMSFQGFNIDLMNAIATEEGFNVEYVEQSWDPEFKFVQADTVDIMGSIVIITPERQEIFDFSEPYIQSRMDVVVNDELKDKSFDDLVSDSSIKFSVMTETGAEKYVLDSGVSEQNIVPAASQFVSMTNVVNGNASVAVGDANTLKYYKREFPNLNIVKSSQESKDFGFLVKQGNTELQEKLNSGLQKVQSNGKYDKIYQNWFNEK